MRWRAVCLAHVDAVCKYSDRLKSPDSGDEMPNHSAPMACPVDGATLVMSVRSGIEIDYCPSCRGVWLDRGELDKIIERGAQSAARPERIRSMAPPPEYDDRHSHSYYRDKRKKSFLAELFD